MTEPRVFVVNQRFRRNGRPSVDLEPARLHGRIVKLLPDGEVTMSAVQMIGWIAAGLADYTPRDYVLGIGDMAACLVAASVAARRGDGRYRLLRWMDGERRYEAIEVDLGRTR